jgi:formylglycine-generating enzyme required for sulfatase activity
MKHQSDSRAVGEDFGNTQVRAAAGNAKMVASGYGNFTRREEEPMQTVHRALIGRLALLAAFLAASECGIEAGASEAGPQNAGDTGRSGNTLSFDLGGGVKIDFVLIQSGSFLMGDADGLEDERPAHKVTISQPFYLGKYEVTQQQWEAVMGDNPSVFKGPQNPVENVLWAQCQAFLQKLNEKFAATGVKFGLPTEAQWEYACRAGSSGEFGFSDAKGQLADYAWFCDNAQGTTHPVGVKKPNVWGLYDMHGNVCEWCADWYADSYYGQSPAVDPPGVVSGCHYIIRGGCFEDTAANCRAAYRNKSDAADRNHNVGVRVMCAR